MTTAADEQGTGELDKDGAMAPDDHELEQEAGAGADGDADTTPAGTETGTDGESEGGAEGGPPWVLVALVAWGLAMFGLAVWSFLRAEDVQSAADERRAAATVAGEFASATMEYDHEDLDGSLQAVTDLATGEYAETYQNAFFQELQPVVDELRAQGTVHVRDVYVSDISDDRATAVVSFDAVIRSTIGTRRLAGSYVRIDLQKEGGEWKADDLTFLATTQEGLDPIGDGTGDGTSATTTTAPEG